MIKGFNTLLYAKLISDDTSGQDGIAIYEPYKKLSGAIEIKPKLNQNSAELYSDTMLVSSDYSVSSTSLTLTVDDDNDDIFCDLIGMIEDGKGGYDASIYDSSVIIGLGYIEIKGKNKYRVKFYPKCKVKPFDSDAKTKEDKVSFQTSSLEVTAFSLNNGIYKHQKTFSNSSAAVEYLKELLSNIIVIEGMTYDEENQSLVIPDATYEEDTETINTPSLHLGYSKEV